MTKILIIDDDKLDRLLLKKALMTSQNDVAIIELNSGFEAVKIIEKERPDLTMLDVSMPGMDGFEVLDLIRNNNALKKHPVIIFSGSERRVDLARSEKIGADEYLVKPFSLKGYKDIADKVCNHPLIAAA